MSAFFAHMGRIEVICGGMFSGKTEELIRRLRRSQIARQRVQIFKPKLDDRFAEKQVVSHSSLRIHAQPVDKALEILDLIADNTRVVGIDEAQFFDEDVVQVSQKLSDRGLRVVAAGLDLDYRGLPFGSMPVLMAIAEEVTKVQAICAVCGMGASRSQRMVKDDDQVLVGAAEAYEPRCRLHHEPHVSDQMKQDLAGITDHSFIQNDQQILDDV